MSLSRAFFLRTVLLLVGVAVLPFAGRVRAQQAKEPADPEELRHQAARHPTAENVKAAREATDHSPDHVHAEKLRRLYTDEVMTPLTDFFDRSVPGGFKAALARARAAGVPEALLAELEVCRAGFDVNFPDLTAALARMETAQGHWQESTSTFSSQQQFDMFLSAMRNIVVKERAEPGAFAQVSLRQRKRAIARAVYGDLQMIDGCCDMICLENNVHVGREIFTDVWLAKISAENPKSHLAINRGADVTGQPFGPQRIGDPPAVPSATYRALAGAVPDEFWKPYRIPGATPTAATKP